jgi:hypothetical protein
MVVGMVHLSFPEALLFSAQAWLALLQARGSSRGEAQLVVMAPGIFKAYPYSAFISMQVGKPQFVVINTF